MKVKGFLIIFSPENPRLLSLGMNGTRSEAEANHLYGPKPRPLGRGLVYFGIVFGACHFPICLLLLCRIQLEAIDLSFAV